MADEEDAPVLRALRRGITTTVSCVDRVPDEHLFRRAILTTDAEVPPEHARAAQPDAMPLGTMLIFDGGVTVAWVVQRIQEWDEMTWSHRKEARRRERSRGARPEGTVH